jgi:hypothetical protein
LLLFVHTIIGCIDLEEEEAACQLFEEEAAFHIAGWL